ncbi:MAG: hypothetical protein QXP42_05820, partial [Candidatus Micrarchaeia archaeon]
VFFLLYVFTKEPFVGVICVLFVIAQLIAESILGASEAGIKKELMEYVIAIVVALVFFYGLVFFLNTGAPLDAVVSCSMLPNLERGDMVVLKGEKPKAEVVYVSRAEWERRKVGWNSTYFDCNALGKRDACKKLKDVILQNITLEESDGLFNFTYGQCAYRKNGEKEVGLCVHYLKIGDKEIRENTENDIIVYDPKEGDYFYYRSKPIIHRVALVVDVEGERHYITKGDNNPVYDIQWGNSPVREGNIHGKVIMRIPYVGYAKILLSSILNPSLLFTPVGCDIVKEN